MRRIRGNVNGERYLANTDTKEVHDLNNERANCQIDNIIDAGHAAPYTSLAAARVGGYDKGHWCLGGPAS